MSRHLGAKAAFKSTFTWNKTFGELVGMYPKFKPSNAERYRRGSVFFKALLNEMKVQDIGTIYRGLSKIDADKFMSNGMELDRNTFTSFSHNITIAKRFGSESEVLLRISGRIPCINYGLRYKSIFPHESEVLLPPGVFNFKDINTGNGVTIFDVTFKQKYINVNKLVQNANKKYNYSKTNNTNRMFLNTNYKWNKQKLNTLLNSQGRKLKNLNKLKSMNKSPAVQSAKRKISELYNQNKKRINFLAKRLKL